MSDYRENIISTYQYFISVRNELITHSINIAMAGELKEIDQVFEVGDTFAFDIDQLRGSNDINLNNVIDLYDKLELLMNSTANINAITEEDLEDEL
jgi:hypothetical protein